MLMASLRRSARLSALPKPDLTPLKQTARQRKEGKRAQSNGISKAKKPPLLAKKTQASRTRRTWSRPNEDAATNKDTHEEQATDVQDVLKTMMASVKHARTSTPPPSLDRPVNPHLTNAALLTPHGSTLVAYGAQVEVDASPSKTGLPRPAATTGTLLEMAVAHLIATDPRLKPVIEQHPCPLFSPTGLAEEVDPFQSLVSSIIGQQVSGAAARSIKDKFVALFNGEAKPDGPALRTTRFPTPAEVAQCSIDTLRTAGLSQRKAEYLQGLGHKFATGELSAQMLLKASDEELLDKLTAVRGLGRWSVEMFACFALKRIDVFSTGDLGVQ